MKTRLIVGSVFALVAALFVGAAVLGEIQELNRTKCDNVKMFVEVNHEYAQRIAKVALKVRKNDFSEAECQTFRVIIEALDKSGPTKCDEGCIRVHEKLLKDFLHDNSPDDYAERFRLHTLRLTETDWYKLQKELNYLKNATSQEDIRASRVAHATYQEAIQNILDLLDDARDM